MGGITRIHGQIPPTLYVSSLAYFKYKMNTHELSVCSARPLRTCPITGLAARYLDPRTNVPFASVAGFQTLTKILSHEYVWSESLGCYTAPGNASGPGLVNTGRKEEEEAAGSAVKKQKIGIESV